METRIPTERADVARLRCELQGCPGVTASDPDARGVVTVEVPEGFPAHVVHGLVPAHARRLAIKAVRGAQSLPDLREASAVLFELPLNR